MPALRAWLVPSSPARLLVSRACSLFALSSVEAAPLQAQLSNICLHTSSDCIPRYPRYAFLRVTIVRPLTISLYTSLPPGQAGLIPWPTPGQQLGPYVREPVSRVCITCAWVHNSVCAEAGSPQHIVLGHSSKALQNDVLTLTAHPGIIQVSPRQAE